MKQVIRGVIIGLALVLISVGIAFFHFQLERKAIEEMSKKFTPEELLEMVKKRVESDCAQIIDKYKNESECQSIPMIKYRDACYYCFGIKKQDSSICEKISDRDLLQSCKKQIGQPHQQPEEIVRQLEDAKKKARDLRREADMRQIFTAQELYYSSQNGAYLTSATWPSNIGSFMPKTPTDPGNGVYVWVDNTKDSQKFCVYATLEEGGWVTASHRGIFKCRDSTPTLNDCCF